MTIMPEDCDNPLCNVKLNRAAPNRGSRRRFCANKCRLIYWVLKKAATLLAPLDQSRAREILLKLGSAPAPSEVENFCEHSQAKS
jgi:hypothetical protein